MGVVLQVAEDKCETYNEQQALENEDGEDYGRYGNTYVCVCVCVCVYGGYIL